ncbi:membrane protein insertase YidC [Geomesophilobacter sediminis]|uniref:Membrane protein insertase YidC n=1 Tax=Geomesophilobacter sediminis TaxID=2798584 RepID=A0A8J7LW05_9BACT|nr:membrane protein insertase YidC [Geomesophilobacter sediminis]MBJ6726179.1 membrane protein insertase YidC [Geomesophilobacter sediminis]
MEKRLVIAIVLSVGILYAYSLLFPAPKPHPVAPAATQQAAVTTPTTAPAAPAAGAPGVPGGVALAAVTPQGPVVARDVTVDTDLYTATFSTQGAALKKFVLKKYTDVAGPKGKPEVLINENAPNRFELLTDSRELGILPNSGYAVNTDTLKLSDGQQGTLEFTTMNPQGIVLKKVFTFSGDKYRIGFTQEVRNNGAAAVAGTLHLVQANRLVVDQKESRFEVHGPVTLVGDKAESDKLDKLLKEPKAYTGNVLWSAFNDKYFMEAVIAQKGSIASVKLARPSTDELQRDIASPAISVAPGQAAALNYELYLGPKDLDILKAQGNRLDEVIDYGWFAPIAKPLVAILKFLYKYTGNYGWAIIIITVVLKLLFFPLTHKSYKSMKEMQKLQPKMNELKEKYKNDRDAMNRAVMELYKTHKVNPMGGCLPMVVQIPVFFGLYRALMYSIELRHAPFMLWITDLSAKDPYYVTPLIMGATMFIQQKMTPSNMDPVQAKMMLALPVVFTFMFLNFPSGLVIYWMVNNVLTIVQQAYINKNVK